jgi:hypothetical protein
MLIYLNIDSNNNIIVNNDMYPDTNILSVNKYINEDDSVQIELALNTSELEQEILKKNNMEINNGNNN